jgi:hypothetical protein
VPTTTRTPELGETHTPFIAVADGALRAAGHWADETWMLLGMTGFGFHVIADPGTCPSSPTAYDWSTMHTETLARIGIASTCVECVGDLGSFEARQQEAIELIKESLDRGAPPIIRTFDYAEFAVVSGYDDEDEVFHVVDITGDPDPILYANLGKPHGSPMLFAQSFEKAGELDVEKAAAGSLAHAQRAWSGAGWTSSYGSGYRVGRQAFEILIEAVEKADSDQLGLRYILRILADAREGVAKYLRRVADEAVLSGIEPVAELYSRSALALARVGELLPAKSPWERPLEKEVLPEAASLLREAMDLEGRAAKEIERLGLDRV